MKFARYFLLMFIFFACKDRNANKNLSGEENSTSVNAEYFPLNDYFLQQLNAATGATNKYALFEEDVKLDSIEIDINTLQNLAAPFIQTNLNTQKSRSLYKENIFMDESTNSYTFNYTAKSAATPVKNINVLVDPASQHVKQIFIDKTYHYKDSSVLEKLTWKNNERFIIIRISSYADKEDNVKKTTVVWNDLNQL